MVRTAFVSTYSPRAAKLRVTKHVRFVDEFVGRNVLTRWLQAATVFVTPTPDLDTMLSGPLSYAMATGRAIVSTPYPYATELLGEDRGVLVAPTAEALAAGVISLLDDPAGRIAMGERAHDHARPMAWGRVGKAYEEMLARVASGDSIVAGVATADRSPRPVEAAWRR
jgi:glycosyltransferase involved in cell wall biosynthesis